MHANHRYILRIFCILCETMFMCWSIMLSKSCKEQMDNFFLFFEGENSNSNSNSLFIVSNENRWNRSDLLIKS